MFLTYSDWSMWKFNGAVHHQFLVAVNSRLTNGGACNQGFYRAAVKSLLQPTLRFSWSLQNAKQGDLGHMGNLFLHPLRLF